VKTLTRPLSHYVALIRALVGRLSLAYAQLLDAYPDHDYDEFAHAAMKARRRGLIEGPGRSGIIRKRRGACCPMCGREL
jgi:hypothetical protein